MGVRKIILKETNLQNFSKFEHFEIIKPMGRGKYSEVYEGIDSRTDEKVVIKILKPGKKSIILTKILVRNSKILREISILEAMKGGKNCIDLIESCLIEKCNVKSLVRKIKKINLKKTRFLSMSSKKISKIFRKI